EVVVEDVEALAAVLGDDPGPARVVDDVVLYETVMAAVHGDSPLRSAVDGVPDQRELVSVRRRARGPKVVMKMNGVPSDLVRSDFGNLALAVELGAVENAQFRSTQILERRVPDVDVRMGHKNRMTAYSGGPFRPYDHVAGEHARVGHQLGAAVCRPGTFVV